MPNPLDAFKSIKWEGDVPPVIPIASYWQDPPEAEPVEEEPEIAALNDHDRQFFLDYLKDGGGWLNLASTNVRAVSYHYDSHTMDVEFDARRQNEMPRHYTYLAVPVQFFVDFVDAGSPGGFVWDQIRRPDAFDFTRYGF